MTLDNLAFQRLRQRNVDLLVWATATSRTSVVTRYAQAAAALTGIDDADPEQAANRFLAWLAGTRRRWLIVLDDLTDPADLGGLWPRDTAYGQTVVTTRRRDAALLAGRRLIDVDLFTANEARAYLRNKLADHPELLDEPDAFAADLGYLPLAMAQAAAYLLDRKLACTAYRKRLAHKRLAELAPHALPDEHQATIAATWGLSIELADGLAPAGVARPVLEIAALLDPNAIPFTVFTTTAVTGYCTSRADRVIDADDTHDAVRLLHQLSLVTVDDATSTVRVHALVQRAVREALTADAVALATTAADALVTVWPRIERDPATSQVLRANTTALRNNSEDALLGPNAHPVLFRVGGSLGEAGLVQAALDTFAGLVQAALDTFAALLDDLLRVLGPDHPDTLTARSSFAYWRGESGDPAGAAEAFEQLLADRLRVLGPDHPTP